MIGVSAGEVLSGVAGLTEEMKLFMEDTPGEVTGAVGAAAEMKSFRDATTGGGEPTRGGVAVFMKLFSETGGSEGLTGDLGASRNGSSLDEREERFSGCSALFGRFKASRFADPGGRQIAPLRLSINGVVGVRRERSGVGNRARFADSEDDRL